MKPRGGDRGLTTIDSNSCIKNLPNGFKVIRERVYGTNDYKSYIIDRPWIICKLACYIPNFTTSPGLAHLTLHHLPPLKDPLSQAALIRADSLRSLAFRRRKPSPAQVSSNFGQSLSSAEIDTLRISNRSHQDFETDTITFLPFIFNSPTSSACSSFYPRPFIEV